MLSLGNLLASSRRCGTEMHQVNARRDIIREWRSLPKDQRQTDQQAEAFAMQIKDKYKFSGENADNYQTIKGWLLNYLSLSRGSATNDHGEREMSADEKSTETNISAAERGALGSGEAEAIAEHETRRKAFQADDERLWAERQAGEAAASPKLYAAPGLPDDTLIEKVRLSTRIRNALSASGLKTVGEIRGTSDATLLSLQDIGRGSVAHLREALGEPSTDGKATKRS
jgi:hypothetical protein